MIMTTFSETILKAISDYRLLLRRHLNKAERVEKMGLLCLRGAWDEENEKTLYFIACRILNDIRENMDNHTEGYYSYSGVRQFGHYLESFLDEYELEDSKIIHKTQRA